MSNYVIFTDSACDLSSKILKQWEVKYIDLNFNFEGENKILTRKDIEISDFYEQMRNGAIAKTSAINPDGFISAFENTLKEGLDIFYLAFSSGLSTTFNSARIAGEELKEKYPDRKIICADSLCASAGQGLLLHYVCEKKQQGASIEELAEYTDSIKLSLCHWFTVDDLVYLKRGGRISPTVAFVGGILGIKPVLHVDNEGKLVSVSKVRGRKASLLALVEKYGEAAINAQDGIAYISHADSLEDAQFLKAQLMEKYNATVEIITEIGPVIGAHSGPGTMALFFLGNER